MSDNKLSLKFLEPYIWKITEDNVLTLSFTREMNAKEVYGMIKNSLRLAGTTKGITETLWFGDGEWLEDKPKMSRHYHIAFLREMTKKERTEISMGIRHHSKKMYIGDKDIVERWIVRCTVPYLLEHGIPFLKKF